MKLFLAIISLIFLQTNTAFCKSKHMLINSNDYIIGVYENSLENLSINDLVKKKITTAKPIFSPYGLSKYYYWIKLTIKKDQSLKDQLLLIDQSRLAAELYIYNQKTKKIICLKEHKTIVDFIQAPMFELPKHLKHEEVIFLKLKFKETFLAPISIIHKNALFELSSFRGVALGFFSGIMAVMFIYNLFLFIILRDKNYFFYILYILFTWLTQISIQGYASKYFWQVNSLMDNVSVILFSNLAILFACLFTISFLNTKGFSLLWHKIMKLISICIIVNIIILFLDQRISFLIMQTITVTGAIMAFCAAYFVYFKKHFKPAGYYLVAWSILLLGAIFFILKDYGIVPYNNFTIYLLQITSAIEVMLLSFALADKINFFKKENEAAQTQALNASLKNQELIQQQNIYLEENVKKRTEELQNANATLNITLSNLKNAQSQLVDAEKMAALGQLTAGIAHEINNPINFVTSNIKPLELDINDLKEVITQYEEIDYTKDIPQQLEKINAFKKQIDIKFVNQEISSLLAGITEGAKRTAEIIRSLKSFSRVDETDIKPVDLNEGIKSTLILLRNSLPDNLIVVVDYGNLPNVECFPGKINQVFMNLISNAIHAIKNKENQNQEEYLTVKTWFENNKVKISIKDTGTGMTEEVKHRIFEPFFTTKEIGEGTGLGLSIVFGIIEKHKGHIDVISNYGEGTEFIITLNIYQK